MIIPQKYTFLLSGLLLSTVCYCQLASGFSLTDLTPEQAGLAIATEIDRRDNGFKDSTANMTMILSNRKGEQSIRKIRNKVLEVDGDGDKSISIFDNPADVKGTVSLTHSHGLTADDQWLYLPSLKRVKRINSKNKSGPFMGSEFAFEDIASQEIEKYSYRYLRSEPCNDQQCYVIERIPAYQYSGYTRQIAWVDQTEFRYQKVDYYDRKNALLKTLIFKDYEQYLDQYWRALTMEMSNHQTGKNTILQWENYQFKNGLTDRDFDQKALSRLR